MESDCESPAKRAKLEFGGFHLHHDDQLTPINVVQPQISSKIAAGTNACPGEERVPRPKIPLGVAGCTSEIGLAPVDPGTATDAATFNTTAFNGGGEGVSSSSDSMGDFYNGGDSGFNELFPPSSSEHSAVAGGNGYDVLSGQEPDSSLTNFVIDALDENPFDDEDDSKDEVASTISHLSGLSDLSDVSGQDWKPIAGPISWVQRQMQMGANPREVLMELVPLGTHIPEHLDEFMLWKIIVNMLSEPPCRRKLAHVNTLDDVVQLFRTSKRIIVLTGAGVSVSCGIPDFRSRDGVYARLAKDFPDLPDPQAMFDIHYFRKDPRPFFKFAREIYPGQFKPSPSHRFIKLLEDHNQLLRNYSQNIDTLEQVAGIHRVIQCHGSFATATCTKCGHKVDAHGIRDDVFHQKIPACPLCTASECDELAVMKPDIVFFGEGLPEEFHSTMAKDKDECDLLIVIGSSLKVRPVALIPNSIPGTVPQVLINREPLKHLNFDVELLGDCDVIINEICLRLKEDWSQICFTKNLEEIHELPPRTKDRQEMSSLSSNDRINDHKVPADSNSQSERLVESLVESGADSAQCDSTSESHRNNPMDAGNEFPNGDLLATGEPPQVPLLDSTDGCQDLEPSSEHDIEALRTCWKPKLKENLAERLPEGKYLFVVPNRYVFTGAEVLYDPEEESCGDERSLSRLDSNDMTSTSSRSSLLHFDSDPNSGSSSSKLDDGQSGSGDDSGVGDIRDSLCNSVAGMSTVAEKMDCVAWSSKDS